jgi:hypothetical protein
MTYITFAAPMQTITKTKPRITSEYSVEWGSLSLLNNLVFPDSGIYAGEGYLSALEAGCGGKGKFLYPIVKCNGLIIAHGCFQELVLYKENLDELGRLFESDSKLTLHIESVVKLLVHLGSGKKGIRILIAGNAQVSGPFGLYFKDGLSADEKSKLWSLVLREADAVNGPYSIVMVKEFPEAFKSTVELLRKESYRRVPSLPIMVMPIDSGWKTFDDYLQAMASKYRIRAKAARKKGVKLQRESWDADTIHAHLEQIDQLYKNVFDKARFRLFKMRPAYFETMKRKLGDRLHFNAYLIDGNLVGFSTFVQHDNQGDAHLIGLDYDANKKYYLYQNILYDYVEQAVKLGLSKLDLGRTAMEIKSTIGAIPEEHQVLVKMRNPILNGISCMLMENSSPKPWVQRHPFKEEIVD